MATRKTKPATLVLPVQVSLPDTDITLNILLIDLLDAFLKRGTLGARKGKTISTRALQVATLFKEYTWSDAPYEILDAAGLMHSTALPLVKQLLLAIPPEAELAPEHLEDGEVFIDEPRFLPMVLPAECIQELDKLLAQVLPYIEAQVKKEENAAALRLLQKSEEAQRQEMATFQRRVNEACMLLRSNGFEVTTKVPKPKGKPKAASSV